jgi:hypothetical protein
LGVLCFVAIGDAIAALMPGFLKPVVCGPIANVSRCPVIRDATGIVLAGSPRSNLPDGVLYGKWVSLDREHLVE